MCIMLTPYEPSSTRLIRIPVTYQGKQSTLLMYTNDLKINQSRSDFNHNDFGDDIFANTTNKRKCGLMIVPIPNPDNQNVFGLVSASDSNVKEFRKNIVNLSNRLMMPYAYWSRGMNSYSMMHTDSLKLDVVRVGNYEISVAPNLEALENQINWDHFDLPSDFQTRKNTLNNHQLYPKNMAYIVAQAVENIEDDGFGVIYQNTDIYFPTAHEENKARNTKFYDVYCYDFCQNPIQYYNFSINSQYSFKDEKYQVSAELTKEPFHQAKVLTDDNVTTLHNFLKLLPVECQNSNGSNDQFQIDYQNIKCLKVIPIKTEGPNQNIWQKPLSLIFHSKSQTQTQTQTKEHSFIPKPQATKHNINPYNVYSNKNNDEAGCTLL